MLIPKTDRNPNLFFPAQIQPSPVEMEHVSTTPDIAKTVNLREPVKLAGHCVTTTLESRGPLLGRRQNFHNNVPAGFAAANG
jgi:hypothetical protein